MAPETAVRLGFFFGVFVLVALWEFVAPRRVLTTSKISRWTINLGIIVLNPIVIYLVFPVAAGGMAVMAKANGWGLLNNTHWPLWVDVVASVVVLDLIIYLQHVMFHAVPILWRLHLVHHADLDIDITTGLRFHPIEIIVSMGIKLAAVAVVGPPVLAVLIFEVLLNGMAMFNHSNIRLPLAIDRVLRLLVVTPDMHRVHHSIYPQETNSNFGFNLSWWDRFLGTYRAQPRDGHLEMTIGLRQYRDTRGLTFLRILVLPFIGKIGNYAIGRRGAKADS